MSLWYFDNSCLSNAFRTLNDRGQRDQGSNPSRMPQHLDHPMEEEAGFRCIEQ